MPLERVRKLTLLPLTVALLWIAGCQQPMKTPVEQVQAGEFGQVRVELARKIPRDPGDRMYLLDRFRVAAMTLADGYPAGAQVYFEELYDALRTQGINEDRTVASLVINEDLKIWKGEPFEQALAFAYYGMQQAQLGMWDNTRAAATNSLFYLRDFGVDASGDRLSTEQITTRAVEHDSGARRLIDTRQVAARSRAHELGQSGAPAVATAGTLGPPPSPTPTTSGLPESEYLDHGYALRESNFTLGYLLHGVASWQLRREREANDFFNAAVHFDAGLKPLTEALRHQPYNTLLVVSWGLGPAKEGYGPDRSLARFRPRTPSDRAMLQVHRNSQAAQPWPQVLDVNRMAADHMWNNLEDVRLAKSVIGSVLLAGGLIAAQIGASQGSWETVGAGIGAAILGAALKASAHVDVRYMDLLPQRYYMVPLWIEPGDRVTLQVANRPGSRLVLAGLQPPAPGRPAQMRYVRLTDLPDRSPDWARSGEILYGNPQTGSLVPQAEHPRRQWPYLLGGRDVQPPSYQNMQAYHAAGLPAWVDLSRLRELYRVLNIAFTLEDEGGRVGLHMLEGGRSLVAPMPGTTGFARLFGHVHEPYQPGNRDAARALNDFLEQLKKSPTPATANPKE